MNVDPYDIEYLRGWSSSLHRKGSGVSLLCGATHLVEELDLVDPPVLCLGLEEVGEDSLGVGPHVAHHVLVCARLLVCRHQAWVRPLDEGVGSLPSVNRLVVVPVDDYCRILFVAEATLVSLK